MNSQRTNVKRAFLTYNTCNIVTVTVSVLCLFAIQKFIDPATEVVSSGRLFHNRYTLCTLPCLLNVLLLTVVLMTTSTTAAAATVSNQQLHSAVRCFGRTLEI